MNAIVGATPRTLPLLLQGEWTDRTNVHWFGAALALVLAFALLFVPRRWAPFTLLALACLIPAGQRVVVLTLDFSFLRILVLIGWMRLALRRETAGVRLNWIDATFAAGTLVGFATYSLLHGTVDAFVLRLGVTFDSLGLYFLFRCLVRSWADLETVATSLALLAPPISVLFLVERFTGRNLFSVLGGVAEYTDVREGRLRCQGAFGHSILAGCFWAAALPLVYALRRGTGRRALALLGTLGALTIIALTASSTPYLAAIVALVGMYGIALRRYLRAGRLGLVFTLVVLHFAMSGPVWHLVARVNVVGGSTGWHRFVLLDETIRRFDEWWLLGVVSTSHWGSGLFDLTNQYVLEAVQSGLLGLVLFLAVIVLGFRAAGRIFRLAWPDRGRTTLAWALGVSLLTQCVSFFGVAYFDQSKLLWFLVIACLSSLSSAREGAPARQPSAGRAPRATGPVFSDPVLP